MTATRATENFVADQIRKGLSLQFIADSTGWSLSDVIDLEKQVDDRLIGKPAEPKRVSLQDALHHDSARIRRAAGRAIEAVDRVRELLAEANGRAAAEAEVRRLEEQLAAARAALKGAPVKASSGAAPIDPKAVRAWAKANGVDCNAVGHVRRAVIEAYSAAVAA